MKNNMNKNIITTAQESNKRKLSFAERLTFIDFVVRKTLKHGMEYRDLFIDLVIANYYYDYKSNSDNESSFEDIYQDINNIKKENTDFYINELMELIKVIDKKLNYQYDLDVHHNPANEALAKLIDKASDFLDNINDNIKNFNLTDFQNTLNQIVKKNETAD